MCLRRTATAALAAAAVMLGATGCGGADGSQGEPTPPAASSSSPTSANDSGGPPAGWQDDFTTEQLDAYEAALFRWNEYKRETEPIYRNGKDTPEARRILKEYSFNWQSDIVELGETYDKGGVRIVRDAEPVWAMAQRVRLNRDGTGSVFISQCTDYSSIRVTQNGEELAGTKPKHPVTPLIIEMINPGDEYGWMVGETTLKDERSCAG